MATVYLAHDLKHEREVAIKVLRPELAAILGRQRFLNEIRLTTKLHHPHILTLIDSGETDGVLWYVLPFIRGESLRARLQRERQLGVNDALVITRQIAGALDYAHRQGVIHRDIKPENILLHEGEAMLTDFGIALAVQQAGGRRLTETGLSLGTPEYMSPEQASGDRDLDARSDVYSLCPVRDARGRAAAHRGHRAGGDRQAPARASDRLTKVARHGAGGCRRCRREGTGQGAGRSLRQREGVRHRADGGARDGELHSRAACGRCERAAPARAPSGLGRHRLRDSRDRGCPPIPRVRPRADRFRAGPQEPWYPTLPDPPASALHR
jgi:Protein kinase domain